MSKNKNEQKKPKSLASKIGDVIINILMALSFIVLGLACYMAYQYKDNPDDAYLFGYKPVYVLTGSMEPTLREHGVCIVQKTTYDEVDVDDILMFQTEDKTITHRIIEKSEEGIRTKGDNNNVPDSFILHDSNVRAKVVLRLNFIADIINDCSTGYMGYVKWIGFPIFVIVILIVLVKVIKKILATDDSKEDTTKTKKEEVTIVEEDTENNTDKE